VFGNTRELIYYCYFFIQIRYNAIHVERQKIWKIFQIRFRFCVLTKHESHAFHETCLFHCVFGRQIIWIWVGTRYLLYIIYFWSIINLNATRAMEKIKPFYFLSIGNWKLTYSSGNKFRVSETVIPQTRFSFPLFSRTKL